MTSEEKAEYEIARDNLIKEMMERIDVMMQLQSRSSTQTDENGFNNDLYEMSKSAFIAVYNDSKDLITDLQTFATVLIKAFHTKFGLPKETIRIMRPYFSRFMTDVSNGILIPTEIPPHLHPMKIEGFRKLMPVQQAKQKQIADELAKRMIRRIAEENWRNTEVDPVQYAAARPIIKQILDVSGDNGSNINASLRNIISALKNSHKLSKEDVIELVPYMSKYLFDVQKNIAKNTGNTDKREQLNTDNLGNQTNDLSSDETASHAEV